MMFRCSRLFAARQARQHGHGAMSIRACSIACGQIIEEIRRAALSPARRWEGRCKRRWPRRWPPQPCLRPPLPPSFWRRPARSAAPDAGAAVAVLAQRALAQAVRRMTQRLRPSDEACSEWLCTVPRAGAVQGQTR